MQNPFSSTEPVTDPSRFYGRQGDIRRIYARIGAERPQSVSIVGEQSMGKSSLLNILAHPETKLENLSGHEKCVLGLLHLRDRDDWLPDKFLQALTNAFRSENSDLPEVSDYDQFRELIKNLNSEEISVVAFFDDFEVITQNPDFPPTFFSFMRSIANTYNVAYITTSSQPLQKLCVLKDVEESPFFNIFTTIALKPLTKSEVQKWIIEESSKTGVSLAAEAEWVYEQVGGVPVFVRSICELVLEHKASKGKLSDDDLDEISDEFQEKVRESFETVWMSLSEPEQTLCAGLLNSSDVSRQEMHIARKLVRRGFIVEVEREYNLFGRAFEKFVAEKMDIELEPGAKRAKRAIDAGKKRGWWKFWKT